MDRSGKVAGVYRRLTVQRQIKQIEAEPPVLPLGPFSVVVADPPLRRRTSVWVHDVSKSGLRIQLNKDIKEGVHVYITIKEDRGVCGSPTLRLVEFRSTKWD
jgi:hypothetical protein